VTPHTAHHSTTPVTSVLLTIALCALSIVGGADAAAAAGGNLVSNPSLESGASFPACFSESGWGTEGAWSLSGGHTGARAVTVTTAGYSSGDRKLLQTETLDCAPAVAAGTSYTASVWYRATTTVALTVFRHSADGWSYWGELGSQPASADWAVASAVTPAMPAGTDRVTFGLSLAATGTLTTDDYSLTEVATTPPATELVSNGSLAAGAGLPTCFLQAGWGTHVSTSALGTDVPAGSPAGARSMNITVSNYTSGDEKLIQSEATGCAPSVTPGTAYRVKVDYRSTSTSNGLTAFQHTASGWSYWTEIAGVPESAAWTTIAVPLPAIPTGVDRIAFGISIGSAGTLKTTGYSLAVQVATPTPTPTPTTAPGTPATKGSWSVLGTTMPVRALHATLLTDGRILMIAGSGNDENAFDAGEFTASVFDPVGETFTSIPVPYDMFCAGHIMLPNGKVLLAGGTSAYPTQNQGPNAFKGSKKSYYFDPADNTFHPLADMAGAHWYPSLTKLGNGDVWSAGGIDDKAEGTVLTEMFDTAEMKWLPMNQVPQTWSFWGTYPHMFLLDDGTMFYSGGHTFGNGLPGTGASLYDWQSAQIWDVPGLRVKDLRDQAGSVLLPPAQDQKVLIAGGGNTDTNNPATSLVDIIDLKAANPTYVPGPTLPGAGKMYLNLVTLFDRNVLSADGATYNRAGNIPTAAMYYPTTNSWSSIDPDPVGRNYHSTALLLPDGRVIVFGSNPADNSFEGRISVYSPPYLFRGPRPTITAAPTTATYGQSFPLGVTGDVVSASLTSPMSVTHQTDTNARLVDVPLAGTGPSRTAQIPANPNLLPPGPYMLTTLDSNGVPSVAKWVWIS
jgi:hypothetical protein